MDVVRFFGREPLRNMTTVHLSAHRLFFKSRMNRAHGFQRELNSTQTLYEFLRFLGFGHPSRIGAATLSAMMSAMKSKSWKIRTTL